MESARQCDRARDRWESCHVDSFPDVRAGADLEGRREGRARKQLSPSHDVGDWSSAGIAELGDPRRASEAVSPRALGTSYFLVCWRALHDV